MARRKTSTLTKPSDIVSQPNEDKPAIPNEGPPTEPDRKREDEEPYSMTVYVGSTSTLTLPPQLSEVSMVTEDSDRTQDLSPDPNEPSMMTVRRFGAMLQGFQPATAQWVPGILDPEAPWNQPNPDDDDTDKTGDSEKGDNSKES